MVATALGSFLFNECKVKRDVTGSGGEFRRLLPATLEKTSFLLATSLSNVPIYSQQSCATLERSKAKIHLAQNRPRLFLRILSGFNTILEDPPRFLSLLGPFPYLGHFALNCDDCIDRVEPPHRVFHRSSTLTLRFLDINGPPIGTSRDAFTFTQVT